MGNLKKQRNARPAQVEKSARAIVEKVNTKKLEITIKVVSWPQGQRQQIQCLA